MVQNNHKKHQNGPAQAARTRSSAPPVPIFVFFGLFWDFWNSLKPKEERAKYASILDREGYTAEDWAQIGHFTETAEVIQNLSGLDGRLRSSFSTWP